MSLTEEELFSCPYCMAMNAIEIDVLNDVDQQQIIDCQVCCQPIEIVVTERGSGFEVIARTGDE